MREDAIARGKRYKVIRLKARLFGLGRSAEWAHSQRSLPLTAKPELQEPRILFAKIVKIPRWPRKSPRKTGGKYHPGRCLFLKNYTAITRTIEICNHAFLPCDWHLCSAPTSLSRPALFQEFSPSVSNGDLLFPLRELGHGPPNSAGNISGKLPKLAFPLSLCFSSTIASASLEVSPRWCNHTLKFSSTNS